MSNSKSAQSNTSSSNSDGAAAEATTRKRRGQPLQTERKGKKGRVAESFGYNPIRVGTRGASELKNFVGHMIIETVERDHPGDVHVEELLELWKSESPCPTALSRALGYWYTLDPDALRAAESLAATALLAEDARVPRAKRAAIVVGGKNPREYLQGRDIPHAQLVALRRNALTPDIRFVIVDPGDGPFSADIREKVMKDPATGRRAVYNAEELNGVLKGIINNPDLTYAVTFGMHRVVASPEPSRVQDLRALGDDELVLVEVGPGVERTSRTLYSVYWKHTAWVEPSDMLLHGKHVYRVQIEADRVLYLAVDAGAPETASLPEPLDRLRDPVASPSTLSSILQKQVRSHRPSLELMDAVFVGMCTRSPAVRGFPQPFLSPANPLAAGLLRLVKVLVEDASVTNRVDWLAHRVLQAHCGRGLTPEDFALVLESTHASVACPKVGWDRGTPTIQENPIALHPLRLLTCFPGMSGDLAMLRRCADLLESNRYAFAVFGPSELDREEAVERLSGVKHWSEVYREDLDDAQRENVRLAAACFHATPDSVTEILSEPWAAVGLVNDPHAMEKITSSIWDLRSGLNHRRHTKPIPSPSTDALFRVSPFDKLDGLVAFVTSVMSRVGTRRIDEYLAKIDGTALPNDAMPRFTEGVVKDRRALFEAAIEECLEQGISLPEPHVGCRFHVLRGRAQLRRGTEELASSPCSPSVAALFPGFDLEVDEAAEGLEWMRADVLSERLRGGLLFPFHPAWRRVEPHLPYGRATLSRRSESGDLHLAFERASGTGMDPIYKRMFELAWSEARRSTRSDEEGTELESDPRDKRGVGDDDEREEARSSTVPAPRPTNAIVDLSCLPEGLADGVAHLHRMLTEQRGGVLTFATYQRRGEKCNHHRDEFLALAALRALHAQGAHGIPEVARCLRPTRKPHVWVLVPPYDDLLRSLKNALPALWARENVLVSCHPKLAVLEDLETVKRWLVDGLSLRPHQEEAAMRILLGCMRQFLAEEGGVPRRHAGDSIPFNTAPMGMGKTLTALVFFASIIAAAQRLASASSSSPSSSSSSSSAPPRSDSAVHALAFVPPGVGSVWEAEAEKFFGHGAARPFVVRHVAWTLKASSSKSRKSKKEAAEEVSHENLYRVDATPGSAHAAVPTLWVVEYDEWVRIVKARGLPRVVFSAIFFDEGHLLRNEDTQRYLLCDARAFARVPLTGTPVCNKVDEIWSLFRKCQTPVHGHPTYKAHCKEPHHYVGALDRLYFPKNYAAEPVVALPSLSCELRGEGKKLYAQALSRVRSGSAESSLATLGKLVDEYSDKTARVRDFLLEAWSRERGMAMGADDGPVEPDPYQFRRSHREGTLARRSYDDLRLGIEKGLLHVPLMELEEWFQRCQKLGGRNPPAKEVFRRMEELHSRSDVPGLSKIYLDEAERTKSRPQIRLRDPALRKGFKTLVFCNTHRQKQALVALLNSARPGCAVALEDGKSLERFRDRSEARVGVGLYSRMAHGFNIQFVEMVIFASLHWNPAVHKQAECRANRSGQECAVKVLYCITEGTVDQAVYDALYRKTVANNRVLEGSGRVDVFRTILQSAVDISRAASASSSSSPLAGEGHSDDMDDDGLEEDDTCVVCQEKQRELVYPCGHLVCCGECTHEIMNRDSRCPMCRAEFDAAVAVHCFEGKSHRN